MGAQDNDVLAEAFSASELGIFPSYREPFGMVFIECMACGTPVIGAASGGPLSFVTEEVGTLIPECEDMKTFSKTLCKTIMEALEEDWKTEKGAACLKLVKDFTMEKQCKQIRDKVLALCKHSKADIETRTKVRAYYKYQNTGNHDQIGNYYSALGEERMIGA